MLKRFQLPYKLRRNTNQSVEASDVRNKSIHVIAQTGNKNIIQLIITEITYLLSRRLMEKGRRWWRMGRPGQRPGPGRSYKQIPFTEMSFIWLKAIISSKLWFLFFPAFWRISVFGWQSCNTTDLGSQSQEIITWFMVFVYGIGILCLGLFGAP